MLTRSNLHGTYFMISLISVLCIIVGVSSADKIAQIVLCTLGSVLLMLSIIGCFYGCCSDRYNEYEDLPERLREDTDTELV